MKSFLKYLGFIWAFPVTFFGLLYALVFALLRWYRVRGIVGDALVFEVNVEKSPKWLLRLWKNWAGHAIGNVIVLRHKPETMPWLLTHEMKHVDQVMRLGVFQPIMYVACYLAIRIGCKGSDPYFSNPFEVDARRAAGQVVDIEGTAKRLAAKKP